MKKLAEKKKQEQAKAPQEPKKPGMTALQLLTLKMSLAPPESTPYYGLMPRS